MSCSFQHISFYGLPLLLLLQAIKIFSEARPPGIYKPDYIDALYAFYHERKPDMITCPSTPEWKRTSEFDLNGEALPDEDDDGVPVDPLDVNFPFILPVYILLFMY